MNILKKISMTLLLASSAHAETNTRLDITLAEVASDSVQMVEHVDLMFLDVSSSLGLPTDLRLPPTNNLVIYGEGETISEDLAALIKTAQGVHQLSFEEVKLEDFSFLQDMTEVVTLNLNGVELLDGATLGHLGHVTSLVLSHSIVTNSENITLSHELTSIAIDRSTYVSDNFQEAITQWLRQQLPTDGARILTINGDF